MKKKVERIAQITYGNIPLIPFRAAIKAAVGKDGFTRIIFAIRDKMLDSGSLDLSWLNLGYLKATLINYPSSKQKPME